ncbi:spheroidene monooxygenase [Dinoroseobacter sp. PD6]|uniref:spheroidene monooxygenase n=1 Tax=Dinoroseobacter sp. PD6 TaxID=3028384 RepID=UPI00237BEBDA|nr:spheroidene monooxygenase [Dinoroseobacter sp. PD6]MDD9718047.1 spheroidene monooxygenase [Dinoroseobacter sp. PD6]
MSPIQTVSLSLFRFDSALDRLWALAQMGAARFSLPRTPDIGFWKLCGSGSGEGFTPVPNTSVYAILATWPDAATARARTREAPVWARYRARAAEDWTIFLAPTSVRGAWSGQTPFEVTAPATPGPLAALTRATVKPSRALKFWKHEPAISDMIGRDPNVIFKIGIGEVPLMQQVTFSIWPDATSMCAFARKGGPHAEAIRAVRDGGLFAEELYARFTVLGDHGTWEGRRPLASLTAPTPTDTPAEEYA